MVHPNQTTKIAGVVLYSFYEYAHNVDHVSNAVESGKMEVVAVVERESRLIIPKSTA